MQLSDSVVFITGANRAIGPAFVRGALARVLTRGIDMPRSAPEETVRRALDALEAGQEEILADQAARQVKLSLSTPAAAYLAA